MIKLFDFYNVAVQYKERLYFLGVYNYQVEDDIGKLKSCLSGFLQEHGLSVTVKDDYVHEL